MGSCRGMGNDEAAKVDKSQIPTTDHSAGWGGIDGKTEEYYLDLEVEVVTWVWFRCV